MNLKLLETNFFLGFEYLIFIKLIAVHEFQSAHASIFIGVGI